MPTLRQEQVIKKLPENNFNLSETMRKLGYSHSAVNGGPSRIAIRKLTKDYYDAAFIKKEYKRVLKETRNTKKHKEQLHALDSMARTKAMFTDNTNNVNTTAITIEEKSILDKYMSSNVLGEAAELT